MPFIIPSIDSTNNNNYKRFISLIEKYRQVIENDTTAHCMIGFTAASILRNDANSIDLVSFESWLKSIANTHNQNITADNDDKINQILYAFNNCNEEEETKSKATDDRSDNHKEYFDLMDDDDSDGLVFGELTRFTSHNPYLY